MSTTRTSSARRPLPLARRAAIALTVGVGVVLTPLPALAGAPTTGPTATLAAPVVAPTTAAQVAVDTALAQLGDRYVWAGAGPDVFDCSGLTQYAYGAAGVYLPHSSRMQSEVGVPVSVADLQPGDLLFFYSPVSHVGMYIGNGQMVHAGTSGDVVKVIDLAYMPGLTAARRIA